VGLNPDPTVKAIYHAPFIKIDSMKQKEIMECSNLTGIVACAVILLMGGWALRKVGL
jgi:hypothetical protein